jgi:hypothetical protein
MGAVRDRERVVDPDVAELRQLGHEGRVVLLLAGMEARVLEQQDVARLHRLDGAVCRGADAVVGKRDGALDDFRGRGGDALERVFRVAALRPAEMREDDDFAALVGDLGDAARGGLDARRIADLAVRHRHIEVDADEDTLVLHVDVVESAERRHDGRCSGTRPRGFGRHAFRPSLDLHALAKCENDERDEQSEADQSEPR